ncbi:MAG: tryptophan synthase subunit alpha [Verrucomicrobiota bacterium]
MNRIDATFAKLAEANQSAFIAYVCAGDPTLDATPVIADALIEAGTDLLELGVPFSDPMADGTVNQQASERALAAGATVGGVFDAVRKIREKHDTPIVLYAYMNPTCNYGFERFIADATAAGVDGLLLLDLPPEEQAASPEFSSCGDLKMIRLIAPTSGKERIAKIAEQAEGFIYYVSHEGVTGAREELAADLETQVESIKSVASVPVVVGFGISKPEQSAAVAKVADGVIVGSAIVKKVAELGDSPELADGIRDLVAPLAAATKSA